MRETLVSRDSITFNVCFTLNANIVWAAMKMKPPFLGGKGGGTKRSGKSLRTVALSYMVVA